MPPLWAKELTQWRPFFFSANHLVWIVFSVAVGKFNGAGCVKRIESVDLIAERLLN